MEVSGAGNQHAGAAFRSRESACRCSFQEQEILPLPLPCPCLLLLPLITPAPDLLTGDELVRKDHSHLNAFERVRQYRSGRILVYIDHDRGLIARCADAGSDHTWCKH